MAVVRPSNRAIAWIMAKLQNSRRLITAIEAVLREQTEAVREEQGCLAIQAYRSIRDSRLCYIHSRWTDEAAFELHAELPRTVQFVARMETLIDHPFEATRARPLA